jgi:outer membrane lipopolysaccharide assembly protein LptE/RlpB
MNRRLGACMIAVLASLVLSACGFQLRRELALPPEVSTIRIEQADPFSPLARGLEPALRRAGATIVDSGDAAVLRITSTRREQLPLAVDTFGRVQEYALRYSTEIELVDAGGAIVLPRQSVELERTFTFDSAEALGSPAEQEIVLAELDRDMVAAILRRLDAALR